MKKQGFFKLVNHRSSLGLGDLTLAHEACMQCVQLALAEKRNASVYYVVLRVNDKKDDEVISEELIFSYDIEKIIRIGEEINKFKNIN